MIKVVSGEGEDAGVDVFVEIVPGQWIHASEAPDGVLARAEEGIFFDGKFHARLDSSNQSDRLIASFVGIKLPEANIACKVPEASLQASSPHDDSTRRYEDMSNTMVPHNQTLQRIRKYKSPSLTPQKNALAREIEALKSKVAELSDSEDTRHLNDKVNLLKQLIGLKQDALQRHIKAPQDAGRKSSTKGNRDFRSDLIDAMFSLQPSNAGKVLDSMFEATETFNSFLDDVDSFQRLKRLSHSKELANLKTLGFQEG